MFTGKKANVIRTLEDFLSCCKMPVAKKLTPDKSRNLTGISILPAICDEIKNVVTFSRLM